jgi:hypothetical protein
LIDTLATHSDHIIALSPFILGEVGKVLSYPRMQALFGLGGDEIHGHVGLLRSISRIVEPQTGLPVVLLDPMTMPPCTRRLPPVPTCCALRTGISMTPHVIAFCAREDIRVMDELALIELVG